MDFTYYNTGKILMQLRKGYSLKIFPFLLLYIMRADIMFLHIFY